MIEKLWVAVECIKYCDGGYRGMDNCNICGRTGSQLLYRATKERFPNTKEGWEQMRKAYPEIPEDTKR